MSAADDIAGLESALAERARKLAEEHLLNGRQARDLILMVRLPRVVKFKTEESGEFRRP